MKRCWAVIGWAVIVLAMILLPACGSAPEPTPTTIRSFPALTSTPLPTFTPTTAPTQTPPLGTPTPQTYTVKAGDTLGTIAARFSTTIQAIAQANNIANPNLIRVGQVLVIPSPTPTPTPTATAAPAPAGTGTPGPGAPRP